jgi:hypothetical protein
MLLSSLEQIAMVDGRELHVISVLQCRSIDGSNEKLSSLQQGSCCC